LRSITVIGGNLFEIAASEYGDALQWINIARANGIKDPILVGTQELLIPPYSDVMADGIGPQ
jgi:hypothetical protein